MNIAVVTTFNNKLYKKYAYRFMETYNWDFDLHVYSENAIPGSYIDLYSVPGCKEFAATAIPDASLCIDPLGKGITEK